MKFKYGPNAKKMESWAEEILGKILTQTGIANIMVTSTKRSPADQARVMYNNLNGPGRDKSIYVKRQLRLYGPNGDIIIRVFEHQMAMGANAADTQRAMEREIVAIGPSRVSAHCSDDPAREVLDIDPKTIPQGKRRLFAGAVACTLGVTRYIPWPHDPADHIELRRLV